MKELVTNIMDLPFWAFMSIFEAKYVLEMLLIIGIFSGFLFPSVYEYLQNKKIQKKEVPDYQKEFENKYIWRNLFVIPLISIPALWLLIEYGIIQVISTINLFYILLEIIFLLILSDTYFYWTHRWMHHKKVYGKIHAVHHASITPRAETSLSFDIWEVIINFSFLLWYNLLMIFLTGFVNFFAVFSYVLIFNFWNVYIHSGYNVFGEKITNSFIGKRIAWSKWHDDHHKYNSGNYAVYFTWWDYFGKTAIKNDKKN